LPLSAIYPPWQYADFGRFEIQPSLAPQYVIYFFAGVVVGALEHERGSLDLDIMLSRVSSIMPSNRRFCAERRLL